MIDFDAPDDDGFAAFMRAGEAKRDVAAITPDAQDVALYIYTSGTTGKPKGVRLSHANVAGNISGFQEVVPIDGSHRSLAFLPWAHVYGGCVELHGMISIGASLAICEQARAHPRVHQRGQAVGAVRRAANLEPHLRRRAGQRRREAEADPIDLRRRAALALEAEARPVAFIRRGAGAAAGAGRSSSARSSSASAASSQFACSGAAALSPDVAEFVDNLGIDVYEGYGMTETSGIAVCNQPHARRIGTVGKPLPGVDVKLDHKALGGDAENGEIIVYGTGVMLGYHNQPEETAKIMTPDGGLRTGDLGRFDSDGFLAVTGRVKELYKLQNGKYVAPAPLEEKLTLSPFIAQVMLHGADKPYNVAIIVPNSLNVQEFAQDAKKLREVIAAELDKYSSDWKSYERVKKFMIADEEFTTANDMLTPTLKVKRRNVIKRYGADLDKLYS